MTSIKSSKKVLVADDDQAIAEAISMILQDAGYEVISIIDGKKIIPTVQSRLVDMMLLDIRMSGVNGGQICQIIKHNPATAHIPVVMVSALGSIEEIARQSEADDYIGKPFEIRDLLGKVKKYIG